MAHAVNLNPHHGGAGRDPGRACLDRLSGRDEPGKFGRMFPGLPGLQGDDDRPQAPAQAMLDPAGLSGDTPRIPAGFPCPGRCVDHDSTLDLTSPRGKMCDPTAVQTFRSPGLDLDSIHGCGPDGAVAARPVLGHRRAAPPFPPEGSACTGVRRRCPTVRISLREAGSARW